MQYVDYIYSKVKIQPHESSEKKLYCSSNNFGIMFYFLKLYVCPLYTA